MKITRVTTAVVQANFDYTYVRIHTDEGVFGTGECVSGPGLTAMLRELGELLIGQDPSNVHPLWARLMAAYANPGAGVGYFPISGIEAALWDLNGKCLGVPVARLLGGAFRDSVEVYADLHAGDELASMDGIMRYRRPFWLSDSGLTEPGDFYWEAQEAGAVSPDAMIARAEAAMASGFRYLKFDLDVFPTTREATDRSASSREIARISDNVLRLRQALGEDVALAFDCHWRFDVPTAIQIAHAIAPARPLWLEDPVPLSLDAIAAVTAASPVPIATGENAYLLDGFIDLIKHRCAHILTPDFAGAGGLLEGIRIGDLASRQFLPIAPHCAGSPLAFVEAAHVSAALSNVIAIEFHGSDVPFWNDLVLGDEPVVANGRVPVSGRPGLGVELDLDVVRRYSAPGEPIFGEPPAR